MKLINNYNIVTERAKNIERISNITKEQFIDLITQKKPINEICTILKISTKAFNDLAKKWNVQTERMKKLYSTSDIDEKIKKMLEEGKTIRQMALELEVNKSTIERHINKIKNKK